MAPQKRTVRLEKKHVKSWPSVVRWGVYLWANVKLISALHHLRQNLWELPCQEQKQPEALKKWGVLLDFVSETIMPIGFLLVNFFWQLVSLFLGGFPTKWCLWLHDSIHDHRGFGTAVRDPMMFDEALKSYGSFAFTPLFVRFGVGGYVCITVYDIVYIWHEIVCVYFFSITNIECTICMWKKYIIHWKSKPTKCFFSTCNIRSFFIDYNSLNFELLELCQLDFMFLGTGRTCLELLPKAVAETGAPLPGRKECPGNRFEATTDPRFLRWHWFLFVFLMAVSVACFW